MLYNQLAVGLCRFIDYAPGTTNALDKLNSKQSTSNGRIKSEGAAWTLGGPGLSADIPQCMTRSSLREDRNGTENMACNRLEHAEGATKLMVSLMSGQT